MDGMGSVDEWMDVLTDGWDGLNGWDRMDGWIEGLICEWIDEWMGLMERWIDGWEGWIN
jgi:hypothetical protein